MEPSSGPSPGQFHAVLDEIRLQFLSEISAQGVTVYSIGSTALYDARRYFPAKTESYQYLHTMIDGREYIRDWDICVVYSDTFYKTLAVVETALGRCGVVSHEIFSPEDYMNSVVSTKGIKWIYRWCLDVLKGPTSSTPLQKAMYNVLRECSGRTSFPIQIDMVVVQRSPHSITPSTLRRNLCSVYDADKDRFEFDLITKLHPSLLPYHNRRTLVSLIESAAYWSHRLKSGVPGRTSAGDQIVKEQMPGPYHTLIEHRLGVKTQRCIQFVLDDNDETLSPVLFHRGITVKEIDRTSAHPIAVDQLKASCPYCMEPFLDDQIVFINPCHHVQHLSCLLAYLKIYWCKVYEGALEKRTLVLGMNGTNRAECAVCRTEHWTIPIPGDDKITMFNGGPSRDYVVDGENIKHIPFHFPH